VWLAVAGALLLLAAPFAEGQTTMTDKIVRVGLLLYTRPLNEAPRLATAFREGLRERGWVEGRNIVIEERWAEGEKERLAKLAAELVSLKVDVIVAPTPWATVAAKNATTTIPVVMIVVDDPVQAKLVASLARPGGNVTGLTAAVGAADIIGKQLDLLTQSVPSISRVTLLKDSTHPFAASAVDEVERAARSLRVQLQTIDVRGPDDFESAFALMAKNRTGAIVAPPRMLIPHAERLATLATKRRLPVIFGFRQSVEAGGFMSYGPDFADLLRRAGTFVDKILRGANPAVLPVEQPTKFELVINLGVAKALGLTIPASVLARADELIE
jgi:putative ABC transport system substrate-binding protein